MACTTYRERIPATVGKQMIFTGPDYKKEHLPKVHQHTSYIGENLLPLEKTGDLRYLWRPASNRSLPAKYKHEYVGEIGWGIPEYNFINKTRLESGFHIKRKEINQAAIDKLSHRYQNPWQPKPCIMDMLGRFSRGCIAWHMGDYEDTNQRNSKVATLIRQDKEALPRASRPPKLPQKMEETPPGRRLVTTVGYEREMRPEGILVTQLRNEKRLKEGKEKRRKADAFKTQKKY